MISAIRYCYKNKFSTILSKNAMLTSEPEYDECIRMNEKYKNVSSLFFWEFGYTIFSYNFDIYGMIDFIFINRIVSLFHKMSSFLHLQIK